MAIDLNTLKLLLWAKNLGCRFERTATLGRLGLSCSPAELEKTFNEFGAPISKEQLKQCYIREPCRDVFADEFLRLLGATEYTSIDRSDYEGAGFLHDLNDPFPEKMRDHFDFVLDGGTLEHVFHYTAGLKHSLELVRVGGHFMTITPANGHMGHGFYQFSPELFFGVFSAQNGFSIRKIVIYESYGKDTQFFEVQSPAQLGSRVELTTSPPVFITVLAQKTATVPVFAQPPQQSDYVAVWSAGENPPAPPTSLGRIRTTLNPYWPFWLRSLKQKLKSQIHGDPNPPSLNNARSFKPLSTEAMAGERGKDGLS